MNPHLRPPRVGFPRVDPDKFRQIAADQIRERLEAEGTDPEQLALLRSGVENWNKWRGENPRAPVRLGGADLSGLDLTHAMLSGASLISANCQHVNLSNANLSGADFSGSILNNAVLLHANATNGRFVAAQCQDASFVRAALGGTLWTVSRLNDSKFHGAKLVEADFHLSHLDKANLTDANLYKANFTDAHLESVIGTRAAFRSSDLTGADCSKGNFAEADFRGAIFVGTRFDHAILTSSQVHGCSVWRVSLEGATQDSLVVTDDDEPSVTVDSLEVAQFIYLLLNNQKVRHVIDTITSKVVLILGRFTPNRKAILDSLRNELRTRNYLPVIFDFEKPTHRDITETVSTLAHMARFVIADLSDPKSIPHELAHVVPLLPSVPIMPLIVRPQKEYAMFEHFFGFRHVLKPFRYRNEGQLLSVLNDKVIVPAEKLALRVAGKRR